MTERGETAVVTGSSRGIGEAIALRLGARGIPVGVTFLHQDRRARNVVEQIRESGGRACAVQMELQDRESVDSACQQVAGQLGPIGILINNAGVSQEIPFERITQADWDTMMAVNLRGAYFTCQSVLPSMVEFGWGRIVNIASIGGQWGGLNQVHYATAKAGLIGFTRSLARVYSRQGITTNAIAPGLVYTEMSSDEIATTAGQQKVGSIPVGRIATLEEVATVAEFLIGEDASYITGQTINVNGGMYFS